ncbi:MAG: adenylate kinase [Clostridia bacterium]|jgi:adenylate kinase|nr:adenylate kinase [Clostridia bacterium]MBQ8258723.1 adenylate kinase [Clostridia bacterium]
MNLIIMGAPGAGKGTQAEIIAARENIPAISTGQILRDAMAAGTELGKTAKGYVENGDLVPDEIVIGIVRDYLKSDACANGFILDGFPRSIAQAEALEKMGVVIDAVLSIDVSDDRIVARMSGRRVCKCGASYHIDYKPSKVEGICDKCSSELYIRADDKAETVITRLHNYHAQTEPLLAFYNERGKLIRVEGQEEVEDTTRLVREALAKVGGR